MSKKVQITNAYYTLKTSITETSILEENATESLIPRIAKASKEKNVLLHDIPPVFPPRLESIFEVIISRYQPITSIYSLTKGNINH